MNRVNEDNLAALFAEAEVDLPAELEARLTAIPHYAPPSLGKYILAAASLIIMFAASITLIWEQYIVWFDRSYVYFENLAISTFDSMVETAYLLSMPEPEVAVVNTLSVIFTCLLLVMVALVARFEGRRVAAITAQYSNMH